MDPKSDAGILQKYEQIAVTVTDSLSAVRSHLEKNKNIFTMSGEFVTCKKDCTVKDLIQLLNQEKLPRVYVVDNEGNLEG
ncbi:hypothetical protein TSUD_184880 [Trifolium subterraneum]|uniref:CBS domain-containing protein n=1 Tax=Trifolium subterraneum TaxID=3900 RepID=A0A2Z6PJK4_TRISU|nr:hypothetical protein TSUD_184880 [Trifolium subterraneum]